jgi:replication factor A1
MGNGGQQGVQNDRPDNFRLIQEVIEAVNSESNNNTWAGNSNNKPKYYKVTGFVQRINVDDKMIYKSCPDCRKKVQDDPAGYRCESCEKVYMNNVPTYMLTAKIQDPSGFIYVTFPKELGDPIMGGKSAADFLNFKEQSSPEEI